MGILFAAMAILCWGVGDFLIQKSARKLGDWEALFFICLYGTILLLPFVYKNLAALSASDWLILSFTSVVILVAALLDFDALRVGKISIIEPIYALEVPITIALTTLVIGEHLSYTQIALILVLLIGVFLVSNKHLGRANMRLLERGVFYAILATLGMGVSNFLFGIASRQAGPIMINWFSSAFMTAATLIYLLYRGEGMKIVHNWRKNARLISMVGIADNAAWVAYSTSTLYLPIGLATGLTESYIALAAILGMTINAEKLRTHQRIGLLIAVIAAVTLALSASE